MSNDWAPSETRLNPAATSDSAFWRVQSSGLASRLTSAFSRRPRREDNSCRILSSNSGAIREGVPPPKLTASSGPHAGAARISATSASPYREPSWSRPATTAKSQ